MSIASVFEIDEALRAVFKSAIVEVVQERKDLVRDIFEEILEDVAFSKAIAEGQQT